MSKTIIIRVIIATLSFGGFFAYMISSVEALTLSNFFGSLAFSVAVGSIAFFAIAAPYGMRTHIEVFGRKQKYRRPVPEIPRKIAGLVLMVVVICCAISFGFYVYGK